VYLAVSHRDVRGGGGGGELVDVCCPTRSVTHV
jgi:hypothetical protein